MESTQVTYHTHNSVDGSPKLDERYSITNSRKYVLYRIVASIADTTVANVVGGTFVMPFSGFIESVGATVDTAGTNNSTTIDVNKNGTSILNTKITVASGNTDSRTAGTTQSVLKPGSEGFSLGDKFTFDVDAISSTPAKGLTIFMNIIQTS